VHREAVTADMVQGCVSEFDGEDPGPTNEQWAWYVRAALQRVPRLT
jgi:hypothetical protein